MSDTEGQANAGAVDSAAVEIDQVDVSQLRLPEGSTRIKCKRAFF